ncbi:MAG: GIY-YIG nuclease family protein [Chroococcidiopsidaceae cyanobacterium CP_BM_ER_R8_30]|nr:GIY-YIG nuclease family protein [Chroococcidiopsidaceae cyanobacterium CP_BM_ER_R8_30]
MFPGFDLSKLPCLSLSQRNNLPECPAVYFAVDSKNRVLYVGKAINLLARWKDHHRLEQLSIINRRNRVVIAWLSCSNNQKALADTESYFINFYQPLFNRTSVPVKKITPAETALRQTLCKLVALDVVVMGFEQALDSSLPIVHLKYPFSILKNDTTIGGLSSKSNTGAVSNVIRANNKRKSTNSKWQEYERRKIGQAKVRKWKTKCNGVRINLSPWEASKGVYLYFFPRLGENTIIQTVAGIEIPTLIESELANILNRYPFVKGNYPRISVLEHDPIPLFWSKH